MKELIPWIIGSVLVLSAVAFALSLYMVRGRTRRVTASHEIEQLTLTNRYLRAANDTKNILIGELYTLIASIDNDTDLISQSIHLKSLRICMELQMKAFYAGQRSSSLTIEHTLQGLNTPRYAQFVMSLIDQYHKGHPDHADIVNEIKNVISDSLRNEYLAYQSVAVSMSGENAARSEDIARTEKSYAEVLFDLANWADLDKSAVPDDAADPV